MSIDESSAASGRSAASTGGNEEQLVNTEPNSDDDDKTGNVAEMKRVVKKPSIKKSAGNELTHLIPGYTAPMRLEAKSLKGIVGKNIAQLRSRASREDSTTYSPSISILSKNEDTFDPAVAAKKAKTPSSVAFQKSTSGSLGGGRKIQTSFASSFRKAPRKQHDNTAGSGWFNMTPTPMTDQLKTDLSIIRNRNYIDPKKFYKSGDSFEGKVLQVGTVIEGSSEYYSSRLTKRDRRQNLTEEIMSEAHVSNYAKRKYYEIQQEKAKPKRKIGGRRGGKRR